MIEPINWFLMQFNFVSYLFHCGGGGSGIISNQWFYDDYDSSGIPFRKRIQYQCALCYQFDFKAIGWMQCLACRTVIKWLWNGHFNTICSAHEMFIYEMPKKWMCAEKKMVLCAIASTMHGIFTTMGVLNVCVKWFMLTTQQTKTKWKKKITESSVNDSVSLFFCCCSLLCKASGEQEWIEAMKIGTD